MQLLNKAYDLIYDCRSKYGSLSLILSSMEVNSIIIVETRNYPRIFVSETFDDYPNGDSEQRSVIFTLEEKTNLKPKIVADGLYVHIKKPHKNA